MARSTVLKPVTIETIDRILTSPVLRPIAGQIRSYYKEFHTDANQQQRRQAIQKLQRLLHLTSCND